MDPQHWLQQNIKESIGCKNYFIGRDEFLTVAGTACFDLAYKKKTLELKEEKQPN
jgi:hypothetical protein